MESIPQEIHDEIFKHITERADLLSLRAVNKFFQFTFTAPAFRAIFVRNNRNSVFRLQDIAVSDLARYIHDLSFILGDSERPLEASFPNICALGRRSMHDLSCHSRFGPPLTTFTNVGALSIHFPGRTNYLRRPAYNNYRHETQSHVFEFLALHIPSPRVLSIHSLLPRSCQAAKSFEFRRLLAGLSDLSIDIDEDTHNTMYSFHNELTITWLKPVLRTIQTLSLGTSKPTMCPYDLVVSQLQFRRLKRLELNHTRFHFHRLSDSSDGLAALILSPPIVATLLELRLSGCDFISVENNTDGWADLFVAFREKLKLKTFEIGKDLTYVTRRDGGSARRPKEQFWRDREELSKLWKSIKHDEVVDSHENKWIVDGEK